MFGELLGWLASMWWLAATVGTAGLVLAFVGFIRGRGDAYAVDPWEAAGGPTAQVTRNPGPAPQRSPAHRPPVRPRAHATRAS